MKKINFLVVALAVLALVGCKKEKGQEEDQKCNSVTLSEKTLDMAVGASEILKATTDPKGLTVTWKSSNSAVVSVTSGGTVTAIAEGEASVTASCGDKTAECKISVIADAMYDMFNIADYGLFGNPEVIPGSEKMIHFTNGDSALCKLAYFLWTGWDGDLTYTDNGFAGYGLYIAGDVAVYIGEEGGQLFYVGPADGWTCGMYEPTDSVKPYRITVGQVTPESYGDYISWAYGDSVCTVDELDFDKIDAETHGAGFSLFDTEQGEYGNDYWFRFYWGFINKMVYIDGERDAKGNKITEDRWAADVDWANMTNQDRAYGFKIGYEEVAGDSVIKFVRPYDYSQIHRVFNEEVFAEYEESMKKDAQKHFIGDQNKWHKEIPAFLKEKHAKDKLYKVR